MNYISDIDEALDAALVGSPGDIIFLPLMGYPAERDAMFIALVIAEYFGSNLHVFHLASNSSRSEEFFLEQIEWLQKEASKMNVQLEIKIEQNNKIKAARAILDRICELSPKLTVMMSRRKGLLQKLTGSIAERVARKSPYSVVVIRSPVKDWVSYGSYKDPKKIVVPIGENTPSEISAVQLAIAIANAGKSEDAKIILLHVITIPETVPIITEDDKLFIQEEKNFIKHAGKYSTLLLFPMSPRVIIGRDIGRSVSRYVNKEQADLLVMGVPYLPRKVLGLWGTDTGEIFNNSECSVVSLFLKDISLGKQKQKRKRECSSHK
jgi:nucleotide-binding universal stress UspA family protein